MKPSKFDFCGSLPRQNWIWPIPFSTFQFNRTFTVHIFANDATHHSFVFLANGVACPTFLANGVVRTHFLLLREWRLAPTLIYANGVVHSQFCFCHCQSQWQSAKRQHSGLRCALSLISASGRPEFLWFSQMALSIYARIAPHAHSISATGAGVARTLFFANGVACQQIEFREWRHSNVANGLTP